MGGPNRDGYQYKEVVDANTGKMHRAYTYNGAPCQRVQLNSRLCSQLSGYALIEKDLRNVAVWLNEIAALQKEEPEVTQHFYPKNRKTYNLVKGLFVAALTFYGKCFSQCEGRPVKLERAQLDAKFKSTHEELITLRHNFAAHSGGTHHEFVDIALVSAKTPGVSPMLYRELFQIDLIVIADGPLFSEVVENARQVALHKIELLSRKILEEEAKTVQTGKC